MRQSSGKPNSVGPHGLAATRAGDHSSGTGITDGLEQPTRRLRTGRPRAPPYLVLLRAGFCLPSALRQTRCALTAPFHPYPPSLRRSEGGRYIFCATGPSGCPARELPGALPSGARTFLPPSPFRLRRASPRACPTKRVSAKSGGMFSVPLSFGLPRPGVTRRTALRSSDFPPASAPALARQAPKGLPAVARSAKAGDRLDDCDSSIMAYR